MQAIRAQAKSTLVAKIRLIVFAQEKR